MERLSKDQQKQREIYANTIFAKAPSTVLQAYLSALTTAPDHVPVPEWAEELRANAKTQAQEIKLSADARQHIIAKTHLELADLLLDMERYK